MISPERMRILDSKKESFILALYNAIKGDVIQSSDQATVTKMVGVEDVEEGDYLVDILKDDNIMERPCMGRHIGFTKYGARIARDLYKKRG